LGHGAQDVEQIVHRTSFERDGIIPRGPAATVRVNTAFETLLSTSGACALLESSAPGGPLARRSLLARAPFALLRVDARGTCFESAAGTRHAALDAFAALRELLTLVPHGRWPDEGAVVGALAYDQARPASRHGDLPLLVALAVARLEVFEHDEAELGAASGRSPAPRDAGLERASSLSRADYRERVLRAQAHIAAGDIYQANLSQRFELPFPRSGLELYRHLRAASPAPFAGYLRVPGLELVSASPERLLHVQDGLAQTRPIAGTRPRSSDALADARLQAELLLSEKERAEHLMLVDLARNDLGRVAALGSVAVDELMVVEQYTHVRHIVSNVRALLAPGHDAVDALAALFPGGTITGVPKRRCMQILDQLEPVPRGFYTGALFYVTRSGRLDANILIRSASVADGRLRFSVGAGIVADSDPEREYEETLYKAAGLRQAAELALGR
jgi:anthranilate/para-aminobenzoate synthase component I